MLWELRPRIAIVEYWKAGEGDVGVMWVRKEEVRHWFLHGEYCE